MTKSNLSKKSKKGKLTNDEKQFIRQNCISQSDTWIADKLGRSHYTVGEYRRKVGLRKQVGRPPNDQRADLDEFEIINQQSIDGSNLGVSQSYQRLSEKQKIEFLKARFRSNYRYKQVVQECTQEQLQFFMAKYTEYVSRLPQGTSLYPAQQDTLYNLTIVQIRQSRYMKQQKVYFQQKKVYDIAKKNGDDSVQPPTPNPQLQRHIKDCSDIFESMAKKLAMTREQRLKQQGQHSYNIISIVKKFGDRIHQKQMMQQAAMQEYVANLYQKAVVKQQNVDIYGNQYNGDEEEKNNEEEKET